MDSTRIVRLAIEESLNFVDAVNSNPLLNLAAGPPVNLAGLLLFGWLGTRCERCADHASTSMEKAVEVRKQR